MKEIIDWECLKTRKGERLEFELFCFHLASQMFNGYGRVEYFYNTPGSEFYIELNKPLEYEGKKYLVGDVLGWQAKYWRGSNDDSNSPLDADHKKELVEGFKKTKTYRPNVKLWIICTPGSFVQREWDKLLSGLKLIDADCDFCSWHKDIFEDFFLKDTNRFNKIIQYYFGEKQIEIATLNDISTLTLEVLKQKFDVELHTASDFEKSLLGIVDENIAIQKIKSIINKLKKHADKDRKYPILEENSWGYDKLTDEFKKGYLLDCSMRYQLIDSLYSCYIEKDDVILKFDELLAKLQDYQRSRHQRVVILNEETRKMSQEDNEYGSIQSYMDRLIYNVCSLESMLTIDSQFSNENLLSFLMLLNRNEFSVFAKPGYGKTHLACSLARNMLERKLPVLFFMGSTFRNCQSVQSLILEKIGVSGNMSFFDVLEVLDFMAELYHCKLPIIIDGLNETAPNENIWEQELPALKLQIKKHAHLMLITTCRDKTDYLQSVYGVDDYKKIDHYVLLDGLVEENLQQTIDKYFNKYKIRKATLQNVLAFNNPLMLKIFCVVNKGKENLVVNNCSLVSCMEEYSKLLLSNISKSKGRVDLIKKHNLETQLNAVSFLLFENNTRFLDFYDQFAIYFADSTDSLINEGLCFTLDKNNGETQVQFTYDMIAGYYIAKSILSNYKNEDEFKLFIQDNLNKFFGKNHHTLAEDIIKSLFYLIPIYFKKEWFEITPNDKVVIAAIDNLDVLLPSEHGRNSFISYISEKECGVNIIENLCNAWVEKIKTLHIAYFSLFIPFFVRINCQVLDKYWNSKFSFYDILQNAYSILHDKFISKNYQYEDLVAYSLMMCGITDKEFREKFCKCAFDILKIHSKSCLNICFSLLEIRDPFIRESVISCITGVALYSKDENVVKCCIGHLADYLKSHPTTNVVLLDDLETLYSYAEDNYGLLYDRMLFYQHANMEWSSNITKEWGLFSVFDYDYDKCFIRPLFTDGYDFLASFTQSQIYGMLQSKAEELGLDEEACSILQNSENEKVSYRHQYKHNYAFKYGREALYELYGWLLLNQKLNNEYEGTFRTDLIEIDPSFPKIPVKKSFVFQSLLPRNIENLSEWINGAYTDWQKEQIEVKLPKRKGQWVLLYGSCNQTIEDKYSDIYLSWISQIVPKNTILNSLENTYIKVPKEHDHAFMSDLTWRDLEFTQNDFEDMSDESLMIKYDFSSWNSDRFKYKSFVCLSRKVCKSLGLEFNLDSLSYFLNEEEVSAYYVNASDFFFFMRKDVVDDLLELEKAKLWYRLEENRTIIGKIPENINQPSERYKHIATDCFYPSI